MSRAGEFCTLQEKQIDQAEAERLLLLRVQSGDNLAFGQIYERYKVQLATNFIRLLRNDELAKDALQDLFVRLWNKRATIDTTQPFTAYLYRIAKNLVIDYYRKASRDKIMQAMMMDEQSQWYQHVEEYMTVKENAYLLKKIIAQLPKKQQEAYILHKLEGKSYKEISALMGISTSTINKHIHTAHKFVKAQIMGSPDLLKMLLLLFLFRK